MNQNRKDFLKDSLIGGFNFLLNFLKNPIGVMKQLPNVALGELIFVGGAFLAIVGFGHGVASESFFSILWGIFLFPFSGLLSVAIASLYFYYVGNYLTKGDHSYEQFFIACYFAAVPSFLSFMVSPFLPAIGFLGFLVSAFLMRMSLVYSFKIEKPLSNKIILSLFAVVILGYLLQLLQSYQLQQDLFN